LALAVSAAATPAALADPQALASSLQGGDSVQSIGVPKPSSTELSQGQIDALQADIGSLDPGRIWIVVASPRSATALNDLADPVYHDLPAGTLLAVAQDPSDANTTNWWVASSWESSDAAQTEVNDVIHSYRKGQGSLFDDLRLEIQSFATGDAAAGHSSQGSSSEPATGGSGSGLLLALMIPGAIVLLACALGGGRYLRRTMRKSHQRDEKHADALAKAHADFIKLGEEITRLDIDSSLANASPEGKDEYRHALGCYEAAERRLKDTGDDYKFNKAVWAIEAGLRHVHAADQLFNPARDPAKDVDRLAQLDALHRRGALTDAEFAEQKAKLIN
jgi:hypothetical protein